MENNSNYFNIHNYINSKLEEGTGREDYAVVQLSVDCANEPYIEIIYVDEDGEQAGLNTNYDNLECMAEYANKYSDVFEAFTEDDAVISVVYDPDTYSLDLIKVRNGNCISSKLKYDYQSWVTFVGYLINPTSNFTYEEKIKSLYEVMKKIMELSYDNDLEESVVFKVKDEIINNIYIVRDFNKGCSTNENVDITNQNNLTIIESVFDVKLTENEKIKKL